MRRSSQSYLPGFKGLGVLQFGGSALKGNPRTERPISIKRPMHLVLRSTQAMGSKSFLAPHRSKKIEALARTIGLKTGVEVKNFANSGNHLHLIVLPRSRKAFRAYVRALSGVIVRLTLGIERGRGVKSQRTEKRTQANTPDEASKFWDARPFTRILEWGRSLKTAQRYLVQNTLEALGFLPYQPRSSSSRTHKTILARGNGARPSPDVKRRHLA